VGQATLIRWYALHVFILPLAVILLSSLHFWRIRKDGGISTPIPVETNPDEGSGLSQEVDPDRSAMHNLAQSPDPDFASTSEIGPHPDSEKDAGKKVYTWPHLVSIELISALVYLVALTLLSILIKAPLQDMANPDITPNPAKAPWYFAGLQELLLHMHPGLAGVLLPAAVLIGMAALPYFDTNRQGTGIWFSTKQGKAITLYSAIYSVITVTAAILVDEFLPVPGGGHGLAALLQSAGIPAIIATGFVPLLAIVLVNVILLMLLRKRWHVGTRDMCIGLVTLYLAAYVVLTIVGVVFRGPGMRLIWPWGGL
jgi:quinol-cytochrome oxidoreductase complex cytochrome b subunit